jgi:hypothetical protein
MSWINEAWRIFRVTPRPVSLRDIADRTGMSDKEANEVHLQAEGGTSASSSSYGSARTGRYYRPVPGMAPPQDRRGKTEKAKAQREQLYLRRRASRPTSQITAARLK